MIEINTWMNGFLKSINEAFGSRVWFVGLQGSYCEVNRDEEFAYYQKECE